MVTLKVHDLYSVIVANDNGKCSISFGLQKNTNPIGSCRSRVAPNWCCYDSSALDRFVSYLFLVHYPMLLDFYYIDILLYAKSIMLSLTDDV